MNYEFKHLSYLTRRVMNRDKLSNEDYIFLTELRKGLRIAVEQMSIIDELLGEVVKSC